MASQYVIDLGYNDDLTTVIKKVNHNFKAVVGQQSKQAQIDAGDATEIVADAVEDLVAQIEHEAEIRADADEDLQNEIDNFTSEHVIPFGSVDNTSTSTDMTATVPGVTQLVDGVAAYIMNGVVTSASGFTLNVNNLGALPVYSSMAAASRSTTIFNVNYTMLFVYNSKRVAGGCWDVFYGYDSNTNTIGYQVRTNSSSLPMSSVTYRYRLLFTSADKTKFVPANNSTSTNATAARTVCQEPIDPFGSIVYYGTTASVAAGNRPGSSYLWRMYTITLGYSFNRTGSALNLTQWKPVYIKCVPQSDGSAIIDSTTPFVQDLPTAEDGKIYIYLGVAYSTTQIELVDNHPVYHYSNGAVRQWTGTGFVDKTGDKMTGDLDMMNKNVRAVALTSAMTRNGGNPIATTEAPGYQVRDTNYNMISKFGTKRETDGTIEAFVRAYNDDSGTEVTEEFRVGIDRNGDAQYYLDTPSALLEALGLVTNVDTSTSYIGTSSSWTLWSAEKRRFGNVITVLLQAYSSSALTAGTTYHIGNVPSAWRPAKTINGTCSDGIAILTDMGSFSVLPFRAVASNTILHIYFTFIV